MAKTKFLTFPIDVELPEHKVRYICDQLEEPISDAAKIAGIGASALSDLGDGGMVLNGNIMSQIRNIVGEINDQQELVRHVEKGVGMLDGKLIVPWTPDPTYVPVLEETATRQGLTVERVAQDLMDYAVSQGWLYNMAPDTVTCFFTRDDFRMICEAFDREQITGSDLAAFIKGLSEQQSETEPVAAVMEEKNEEVVHQDVPAVEIPGRTRRPYNRRRKEVQPEESLQGVSSGPDSSSSRPGAGQSD